MEPISELLVQCLGAGEIEIVDGTFSDEELAVFMPPIEAINSAVRWVGPNIGTNPGHQPWAPTMGTNPNHKALT